MRAFSGFIREKETDEEALGKEIVSRKHSWGAALWWKELALIQLYHAGKVAGAEWKWGVRKGDRIGRGIRLRFLRAQYMKGEGYTGLSLVRVRRAAPLSDT